MTVQQVHENPRYIVVAQLQLFDSHYPSAVRRGVREFGVSRLPVTIGIVNADLYLSELLHLYTPSRPLRSALRSLLDIPRPRDSKTKTIRSASLQVCCCISLECIAWRHQGK